MPPNVPTIFDPQRRYLRSQRALARQTHPGAARWLGEAMAEDIAERLAFLRHSSVRARVSGLGSEAVITAISSNDIIVETAPLNIESPIAGGPFDLIVSIGELDTINDLPGALLHLRHALGPGGLLLAAMPGAGSLPALRSIMLAADGDRPAARIHPQIDSLAASGLLQRTGFARQVVDHYPLQVSFTSLTDMVRDLRDQALGSILADRPPPLGKQALARAHAAFAAQADSAGRVFERFEIITLTGWRD